MRGVANIGSRSHVGSQSLDEVHHCVVDVFLWWLSTDGLQGDFQLISLLRLRLEFMHGAFPVCRSRCDSPVA